MKRDLSSILFLKATKKKQIWIAGYTKADGTVVPPHSTMVHVSDDHDGHKLLAGQGTHTQKLALAALKKHPAFEAMPHDEKVGAVLHHATEIQDKASWQSAVSVWKKTALAGKNPTPAQWAAFSLLDSHKAAEILGEVKAKVGLGSLKAPPDAALAALNEKVEAPGAPAPAPAPAPAVQVKVGDQLAAPSGNGYMGAESWVVSSVGDKEVLLQAGADLSLSMQMTHEQLASEVAEGALAKVGDGQPAPEEPEIEPEPEVEPEMLDALPAPVKAAIAGMSPKHLLETINGFEQDPLVVAYAKTVLAAKQASGVAHSQSSAVDLSFIDQLALPLSNTNHKAVNKKVAALKQAAVAGKVSEIEHMAFGSNSYGKKLQAAAYKAVAAIKASNAQAASFEATAPVAPAAPAAKKAPAVVAAKQGGAETAVMGKVPPKAMLDYLWDKHGILGPAHDAPGATVLVPASVLLAESGYHKAGDGSWTHYGHSVPAQEAQDRLDLLKTGAVTLNTKTGVLDLLGVPPKKEAMFHFAIAQLEGAAEMHALKAGDVHVLNAALMAQEHAAGELAPDTVASLNGHSLSELKGLLDAIGDTSTASPKALAYLNARIAYLEALDGKASSAPKVTAASEAASPKDGDTKQGADGLLVFKDGRWHKSAVAGTSIPLAFVTALSVKTSEELQEVVVDADKGKLDAMIGAYAKHLIATKYLGGDKGIPLVITAGLPPEWLEFADGADEEDLTSLFKPANLGLDSNAGRRADYIAHLLNYKFGSEAPGLPPKVALSVPEPAPVAAPVDAPAGPLEIDGWKQVGGQEGYNPGGTYEAPDGQRYYVKFPSSSAARQSELLANKLYAAAGVEVAQVQLAKLGGKVGLASLIVDAKKDKAALLSGKPEGLLSGFAVDAWLANWDVVGNNPAPGKGYDNVLVTPGGKAVRIDQGGSLAFGGAGGKKGLWGPKVGELVSMRDAGVNAQCAAVFGAMGQADIAASVAKVAGMTDAKIKALVQQFGPSDAAAKDALSATLIARREDMIKQYPQAKKAAEKALAAEKAALAAGPVAAVPSTVKVIPPKISKAKEKIDPTALKVDIALLPKVHDFLNWGGSGKPISSKPYVQQNMKDEAAILAFALKGNLVALKAYRFQPVDKEKGTPLGAPAPMQDHPSAHVKEFYDSCVNFLEVVANPPEPLSVVEVSGLTTAQELAQHFKPFDYGQNVSTVPANQRLGFWIALGQVTNAKAFMPPADKPFSEAVKAAAAVKWKKYPQHLRTYLSNVQSSGSANQPYRDGKEKDHAGNDCRQVVTDCYAQGTAHAEGSTISKWIDMPKSMVDQFMANPEGLVFQNPGSMCCSRSATKTSSFGEHRVTIRFAKGAIGMDTFGSGMFQDAEQEITTVAGARFMVLKRAMVEGKGGPGTNRLELEVIMLPPDPTYIANLGRVPTQPSTKA